MEHSAPPLVSVVVPIHNEGDRIEANLAHIVHHLEDIGTSFEVVAVDDGSSDSTWDAVNRANQAVPGIRLLRHLDNKGKGSCLRDGILASTGTWILLVDADLELPIELSRTFFEIQRATGADIVVGSKRHPNSVVTYPRTRRLLSQIYYWVIALTFNLPVSDTQVGFKLIRGSLGRRIARHALVNRFGGDIELLVSARLAGARMVDAPIALTFGRKGGGRISPRTVVEISKETAGVWFRRYINGHYVRALQDPTR
jgi:glycosyltransferase involved in cell wall biosynthesis